MSQGAGFTPEQQFFFQGLAMGTDVARKVNGLPVLSNSGSPATTTQVGGCQPLPADHAASPEHVHYLAQDMQTAEGHTLCAEEKAKRAKNPLDMWDEMQQRADTAEFPKGTDVFLQKFHGIFYVAPAQDAYMCRLRFAGGALRSSQLDGLAELADRYAGGYADVTTRANLQLREISANDPLHVLYGLRDLGIINVGAGGDNIRNITASPLSGLDREELIETLPLARRMHHHILNHRELYGLPRKFNIAFDGGGRISALEDTNDIGFRAVSIPADRSAGQDQDRIVFQLCLGGITGHQDFARPSSVVARPDECIELAAAIVKVFLAHGDRTDRKKARLKYLLDDWGHERFVEEVERELGRELVRADLASIVPHYSESRTAHVGIHPQKQANHVYVGVVLPVGRMNSAQMRGLAKIARTYGNGDIRLTVWQNLILPNILEEHVDEACAEIVALRLDWKASNIRAGLIACTGNAGCKFAAADTKSHAMYLANYIEERIDLEQPINLHLTGCHHSCAQHYIGDIGFQATGVEDGDDIVEGYHIVVGGGYGERQNIGRELFASVRFDDIPPLIVRLLESYHEHRNGVDETFCEFAQRHSIDALRDYTGSPTLVH